MIKPLTTTFSIGGTGLAALKQIQKGYESLRNMFKKTDSESKGFFESMKTRAKSAFNYIKNGAVKVGNAFKTMGARSELAMQNMNNKSRTLVGTLTRIGALLGGGMAIRQAYEGATSLEMERTAITSMRGEKRASELMNFGVQFANVTPYQTSEVLSSVKQLELRGLDPTRFLGGIGNMSAMLGKPLAQGVEAILDAMTGEFERMKEFGITKKMIEDLSPGSFDKKGSLLDQKKMFNDLMGYIENRYKGGMEHLSRTTSGLMSTVKGIYGSFTNMLLTGTQTGLILERSPLGIFKDKILRPLADDMQKWQQDGTFEKWSESFGRGVENLYSSLTKIFSFITEYKELIISIGSGFLAMKLALGSLTTLISTIAKFQAISTTFKSLGLFAGVAAGKLALITGALGVLVAAVVYAYRNFKWFNDAVNFYYDKWSYMIGFYVGALTGYFETIKEVLKPVFDWIGGKFDWLFGKIEEATRWIKNFSEDLKKTFELFKTPEGKIKTSLEDNVSSATGTQNVNTISNTKGDTNVYIYGATQKDIENALANAKLVENIKGGLV